MENNFTMLIEPCPMCDSDNTKLTNSVRMAMGDDGNYFEYKQLGNVCVDCGFRYVHNNVSRITLGNRKSEEVKVKEETKKVTVWINTQWSSEGYQDVLDTRIPLSEWETMSKDDKDEMLFDDIREVVYNVVSFGFTEE